ncbi:hypothetical protein [Natronomonas sp. EA1]|uniref:hypothetical protein n=1 Tax=Natronomonas sp. EA1 TaxID=3421655 RepID=UPI003EC1175C
MSAQSERSGPLSVLLNGVFLKVMAFAVFMMVLGFAAPFLMAEESEFVGIVVGMSWSIGILIFVSAVAIVVSTAVREALR